MYVHVAFLFSTAQTRCSLSLSFSLSLILFHSLPSLPLFLPPFLSLEAEMNVSGDGASGSGSEFNATGSGMFNETEPFNCLADDISSTTISNRSFWQIREELRSGAPVVAAVFCFFFVVAFVWNLFIIVTFLHKRQLMKVSANILLLNLAIADLMVAVTQMVFSIITESSKEFIFGSSDTIRCRMCDFSGVLFMLVYGVSMHTLAALAFDRFLLLYAPFKYKTIMNRATAVVLVLIIWAIALILAIPPVLGFGQIEFNLSFGSCVPRFGGENPSNGLQNFYYVAYIAIESLFPIITIAACSLRTYLFVNRFLRKGHRRRSFYSRRGSNRVQQQQKEDSKYQQQQKQLIKVFGALLISNVVAWSPVLIVIIAAGIRGAENIPHEVYVFGWICFLTAPVFHPIIESFFVKDMRIVVNRGILRAKRTGSFIARSTSNMFSAKDLELAHQKLNDENYTPEKRKIMFLGKKNSILSAVTEVTDINMENSNTPSPRVEKKLQESNDVTLRNEGSQTPAKQGRRITFSDETPPGSTLFLPAESPPVHNGVKKSSLKSPKGSHILPPLGEIDFGESNGSVFSSPVASPSPNLASPSDYSESETAHMMPRSVSPAIYPPYPSKSNAAAAVETTGSNAAKSHAAAINPLASDAMVDPALSNTTVDPPSIAIISSLSDDDPSTMSNDPPVSDTVLNRRLGSKIEVDPSTSSEGVQQLEAESEEKVTVDNGVVHVPVNESNFEQDPDLELHKTVYHERRGSLTLV